MPDTSFEIPKPSAIVHPPVGQLSVAECLGETSQNRPAKKPLRCRSSQKSAKAGKSAAPQMSGDQITLADFQNSPQGDVEAIAASQDSQSTPASTHFIAIEQIRALRQQWSLVVRSRQRLELAAISYCRRLVAGDLKECARLWGIVNGKAGDHERLNDALAACGPIMTAMTPLDEAQARIEKAMIKLAKTLPCQGVIADVKGFAIKSFAQLVGEAGDLGSYKSHSALWKRFGLGCMTDGGRARKFTDVDKALEAGYSPQRRAIVYVIGECLLKAGGMREVYDYRKAHTETTHADWTKAHRHADAMRYSTKRLLRRLWQTWREETGVISHLTPAN